MTVKIAGALPKPDTGLNGAEELHRHLLARPQDCYVIVALVKRSGLAINDETGQMDPTLKVQEIEVMLRGDAVAAYRMLADTRRARIRTDREPTGGLFGDPIEETAEKLADQIHRERDLDAGETPEQEGQ